MASDPYQDIEKVGEDLGACLTFVAFLASDPYEDIEKVGENPGACLTFWRAIHTKRQSGDRGDRAETGGRRDRQ